MIKVLIVDDSSFMRKLLSDILNSDPEIKVIGSAKNGSEALKKVEELKPDVITLDIRLPDMSGLDVLNEIMNKYPTPTIIISAYTKEGAKESIQSFDYGAVGIISKPSGEISVDLLKIKEEIIKSVKGAMLADISKFSIKKIKKPIKVSYESDKKLVIIGASTGGPQAIHQITSSFSEGLPVPLIIVQHMPGQFTKIFAERLNKRSGIRIKEAKEGDILTPGEGYVAPGDYNLEIIKKDKDCVIHLIKKKRKELLSINMAFNSAAKVFGDKVISIVLTGMGDDGAEGAKQLKKLGSVTIAQDEKTSVVFGMPKEIIKNGDADFILPLNKISEKIANLLHKKSYKS